MFSATVTNHGFDEALDQAIRLAISDFAPELARAGQALVEEVREGFMFERDPYGQRWTALNPLTVKEKRAEGSSNPEAILQDSGKLLDSFAYQITPEGISIYTDRSFPDGATAEIHQFGGIHPRTRSFIPQREMLPFSKGVPPEWTTHVEVFLSLAVNRLFK